MKPLERECASHAGRLALGCPECADGRGWRSLPSAAARLAGCAAARAAVGARFRFDGRDPATGLDCAGVVWVGGTGSGLALPRWLGHNRHFRGRPFLEELHAHGVVLADPLEAIPGDVLVAEVRGNPSHLAWLSERGTMIHAMLDKGRDGRRVVEHRLDEPWARRVLEVVRFTEFERWDRAATPASAK